MKFKNLSLLASVTLALAGLPALAADNENSLIDKSIKDNGAETYRAKNKRDGAVGHQIKPDQNGVRQLDMTNPAHYQLVKSRLEQAQMNAEDYPQLHQSFDDIKQQQQAGMLQEEPQQQQQQQIEPFPEEPFLEEPLEETISLISADPDLIENSHMFLNMQIAVSPLDNEAYLVIRAESSVYGGTISTFIDLLVHDSNYMQIAPWGESLALLEGTSELAESRVSLRSLKQNYPNLDTIYANSIVMTEAADGTKTSGMRYTEYPWDWESIEAIYGANMGLLSAVKTQLSSASAAPGDGKPVYSSTAPIDLNADGVIKVCLNRTHSDCDYGADQSGNVNSLTYVNIPFQGQVTVPHEVFSIYSSDPAVAQPNGIDERTNIYLQEGIYGGITKQGFRELESGTGKRFSDYLDYEVDPIAKKTIISWNIPRSEGRFGNAQLFSNIAQADWRLNFAVRAKSFFRGRTGNYQFQVNSNTVESLQNFFSPALEKIKLGYSCLAKGTMITMADGSLKPIDQILKGEMVLGANAENASTAQPMQVVDTSIGIEALKMFRITGADGSEILMTETHPVSTSNKGIVWAKELKKGDRILTGQGSVLVTQIKKEKYNDNVYNLKLAVSQDSGIAEGAYLGMFANGLLVGDLDTQDEHNYKDQFIRETPEEKLQRLPAKWKTDYISSLK